MKRRISILLVAVLLAVLALLPVQTLAEEAYDFDPWNSAPLEAPAEQGLNEASETISNIMLTNVNFALVPGVRPSFTMAIDPNDPNAAHIEMASMAWYNTSIDYYEMYPEQGGDGPTPKQGVVYKLCTAITFEDGYVPADNVTFTILGKTYKGTYKGMWGGKENTYMILIEQPVTCSERVPIYRMYNSKTSEHMYTKSAKEYNSCGSGSYKDWKAEGVAWYAPKSSAKPVYRLYNLKSGDHHYTTSATERDKLVGSGQWRDEGIAFYSAAKGDEGSIAIYRIFNGRLKRGQHHYTKSATERDKLVASGQWRDEGVGFYGYAKP